MPAEPNHKLLYSLIGLAVLVNFTGLMVPLMDPDVGLYASVAKTMVQENDCVNLYFHDMDWLDKPHFPFWVTALSFKVFGFHDWAYKLPGILFMMMGAFYTYLFAKKYYNKTIAGWSVLILLTALHILISNNDVRAEPYLTGLIIAAVYHFSRSLQKNWGWQLLAACCFTACAVMTKGIFILVPIGGALAGQLIISRNWQQLFHWKWIVTLLLVSIFIIPELYCLWKQFDTHPEKTVFGSRQVSGIKFFLWESQFGRFFNTGPITGKGDKFFFLHTLLWAFLPWSLILYAALFTRIRSWIRKVKCEFNEWFTLSGSLLALLLFSFSGFQLPHYANIIFPMLAILSAHFIWQLVQKREKIFSIIQTILAILMILLAAGLFFFYRPEINYVFITAAVLILILFIFLPRFIGDTRSWLSYFRSGAAILLVGLFLNLSFYPDLLKYQAGNQLASFLNKNYPDQQLGRISMYFPSGEFYMKQHVWQTDLLSITNKTFNKAKLLYVTEEELKLLELNKVSFETLNVFSGFHITMLNLRFLNPATREQELKKTYLLRLP